MKIKDFYHEYEKEILLLVLILFWAIPYFGVSYLSAGREVTLGFLVDEKIPFIPGFVLVYMTAYFFAGFPYFFVRDKGYFRKVILTYMGVMSFCFLVYFIFPVEMIRPEIGSGFFEEVVGWIYSTDVTHNCFPSLHVVMVFLSAMFCFRYDRKYWWLLVWSGLIIVSTLFVKQHYFLDIVGGLLVGVVGYWWFSKRLLRGGWERGENEVIS